VSLKERLPRVLPLFNPATTISALIGAHDDELVQFDAEAADVQDSLFVGTADGQSLDLIGDDFGPLGQRRGRGDDAYRQFLRSLVPAFDGRGTERDVEVAVAAGVATTPDEIDLRQQFADVTFQVELFDWTAHRTGTVHELAALADPAAVERIDPLYYFSDRVAVGVGVKSADIDSGTTLQTAVAAIDADSTTVETRNSDGAFGTDRFDGESQFS